MGQSSTSLQELSFQERMIYLVVGYTKEQLTENDLIKKFDTSINSVIGALLGNIFLRFDKVPSECKHVIKDNGSELHRVFIDGKSGEVTNDKRFMVGCSQGMNKGVHEWKIQVCQDHNEEIIGITTNVDNCEKLKWIGYNTGDTYYFYGGDKKGEGATIQTKINGRRMFYSVDEFAWKKDDIIKIRLDCVEWMVSFYVNDKQIVCKYGDDIIKEWKIAQKDCTYYPVICLSKAMKDKPCIFRVC